MLDSLDGDFLDDIDMEEMLLFWERLRRERLGVVAEVGEGVAATCGGSTMIGGSLRGGFASEFLRGGCFDSRAFALAAFATAGDGASFAGAGDGRTGGGAASWEDFSGSEFPLGLEPLSSVRGGMVPFILLPPRPPPRPPRPPPLPARPRPIPRKADPCSPLRPQPDLLLGGWLAHIDELTPPEEDVAVEAMEYQR